MDKKEDLLNMLDQILIKFEWQDAELKKTNPLLTGDSWDLFHLKSFKNLLLNYLEDKNRRWKIIKPKKQKYYAVHSKNDNFLHGVFPLSKEGYDKAIEYISKINPKNKEEFIIRKK